MPGDNAEYKAYIHIYIVRTITYICICAHTPLSPARARAISLRSPRAAAERAECASRDVIPSLYTLYSSCALLSVSRAPTAKVIIAICSVVGYRRCEFEPRFYDMRGCSRALTRFFLLDLGERYVRAGGCVCGKSIGCEEFLNRC